MTLNAQRNNREAILFRVSEMVMVMCRHVFTVSALKGVSSRHLASMGAMLNRFMGKIFFSVFDSVFFGLLSLPPLLFRRVLNTKVSFSLLTSAFFREFIFSLRLSVLRSRFLSSNQGFSCWRFKVLLLRFAPAYFALISIPVRLCSILMEIREGLFFSAGATSLHTKYSSIVSHEVQ